MKDKTVEYQKTALFIPKELHQAIKIRSAQSGETMTDIIISALSELFPESTAHKSAAADAERRVEPQNTKRE